MSETELQFEEWKRPNVRRVHDWMVPRVEAIVAKVNKRAIKIGAEPFVLTVGQPFEVPHEDPSLRKLGATVTMVELSISGAVVKINGYELLGRIDFEDGMVIVNSRPGVELPAKYRCASSECDHCKVLRKRNAVFVFEKEGATIQVGRSCLKDFFSRSPEAALWAASEYGAIMGDIDEEIERGGGGYGRYSLPVIEILTAACYVVEKFGFVSKKYCEEHADRNMVPTSGLVSDVFFDKDARAEYKPSAENAEKAEKVIAWVKAEFGAKAEPSDFEFNALQLVEREAALPKRIGLLTALVGVYDRATEERIKREKQVNAWVGKVGERKDFEAVFAGVNWFETDYGSMAIARFYSPEGLLVYKGSTVWWEAEEGETIKFKATIKAHAEWKDQKQTLILRAKQIGPAVLAAAEELAEAA